MTGYYAEFEGRTHIRKEMLKVGAYYYGHCRNANVARWDGKLFWYWREKFGHEFVESIECPEDDGRQKRDLFFAEREISTQEIPLQETQEHPDTDLHRAGCAHCQYVYDCKLSDCAKDVQS